MFSIALQSIYLLVVICIVFGFMKVLKELGLFLQTYRNHWIGMDSKEFIETAAERVLRICEEEYGKKHDAAEGKRMTLAEGMMNDVLREAGFNVTKFNIKGLLQAKKQEKGL